MKKFFIAILLVLSSLAFTLVGCGNNSGVSVESKYFNVSGANISTTVSNDTDSINIISNISVKDGASCAIYSDAEKQNIVYGGIVDLDVGENIYYLLVENKEESKTYTVNIYRKNIFLVSFSVDGADIPTQNVEEGDKAKVPEITDWSYTCTWNFDFNSKITQDTTIFGEKHQIEVEEITNLGWRDFFSIKVKSGSKVEERPYSIELEGRFVKAKYEEKEIPSIYIDYYEDISLLEIKPAAFDVLGRDKNLQIKTTEKLYNIVLDFVTFAIESEEDLNANDNSQLSFYSMAGGRTSTADDTEGKVVSSAQFIGNRTSGYIILANDIDFEGHEWKQSTYAFNKNGGYYEENYGFCGVFDGRGYSIKNFTLTVEPDTWRSMFGNLEDDGVFMDLSITGFTINGKHFEGIFSKNLRGTLKNLYIDGTINADYGYGLLSNSVNLAKKIENCVFVCRTGNRSLDKSGFISTIKGADNKFENCVVITDYTHPSYEEGGVTLGIESTGIKPYTLDSIEKIEVVKDQGRVNNLSGVTKVYKGALDITSSVTITAGSVTIPSSVWDTESVFLFNTETGYKFVSFYRA